MQFGVWLYLISVGGGSAIYDTHTFNFPFDSSGHSNCPIRLAYYMNRESRVETEQNKLIKRFRFPFAFCSLSMSWHHWVL